MHTNLHLSVISISSTPHFFHVQRKNIAVLENFIDQNQHKYLRSGQEIEKDNIEEQIGSFSRACSSNITKLHEMITKVPVASPAKGISLSSDVIAHRHGVILILSERLAEATKRFDVLRSARYKSMLKNRDVKRRRTPSPYHNAKYSQQASKTPMTPRSSTQIRYGSDELESNGVHDVTSGNYTLDQSSQYQQHLDAENLALQEELIETADEVQRAERNIREIATLNQMFSTAILQQSEQIEKLYSDAVAATGNIKKANVQLDKAVKVNRSSQKIMFFFLLFASIALLFLDWYYS